MEEVYTIYKTDDNKALIEVNKGEFEGKTYSVFVANEAPHNVYVAEVKEGNKFEFVTDKSLLIKILKEIKK